MLSQQEALIYTMVLVSAADNDVSDAELEVIGDIIDHLPVFKGFDWDRLGLISNACADLLQEEEGLDKALGVIKEALPGRLRETAYALACDIAAADGQIVPEEIRILEMLRYTLDLDRLIAAGIERGTAARFHRPT